MEAIKYYTNSLKKKSNKLELFLEKKKKKLLQANWK